VQVLAQPPVAEQGYCMQLTGVPVAQVPMPLQVPAGVKIEPLQEATAQI
jgi:hypothetical protein